MEIKTEDYEKLGTFYLGREYDLGKKELQDELVLYDSKDLTTHGVVLGMTGSGKTGLSLAILEEAAIDGIPAIIIDPKGDIANLMLTFPGFDGASYRPWINEDDAAKRGMTPDDFAQAQGDLWKKGLNQWGQTGERVQKFKDSVDINVFTPGSGAGIPVSILSSLDAPPFEIVDDAELFGDRIESTVSSLLTLLGIDADPIQSKEHILLSNIFAHYWAAEEGVTLEKLVVSIQSPPFDKVGVLGLESFYPEKKRGDLAMRMNNLLAAPGFKAWLRGEPLDIKNMLHTPEGKPRISIFSIAHLNDTERMFFVSLLLNQMLSWMRSQSGTSSLRAMLYMDEIYGYLPPSANPPSKKPMLTILKQARAFGLGTLLATQNPVDLDYKALSNMGTWFLGRLQTERDKMRVLDGLEGAASSQGSTFNRAKMEQHLAGLGSRVFLMNNVHEDAPVTFHVRWVMSYLRGPMTRRQIKTLMDPKKKLRKEANIAAPAGAVSAPPPLEKPAHDHSQPPTISAKIPQVYLPIVEDSDAPLIYLPAIIRSADVHINDSKTDINGKKTVTQITKFGARDEDVDWDEAFPIEISVKTLPESGDQPCQFTELPGFAIEDKNYEEWGKDYVDHLYRTGGGIEVFRIESLDAYSKPGESEADFRIRLQGAAREKRDELVEELREKYGKLIERAERKLDTAVDKLEEQQAQASSAKMNTAVNIGTSILGALFGRKRMTTAMRSGSSSASRAMKERRDVKTAERNVEGIQIDLSELEDKLRAEIEKAKSSIDPMTERLEREGVKVLKRDIDLKLCGLAWLPYHRASEFELEAAWR
ncbi:MAG: hypothetical protein ACI9UA_001551 [Pseudoalteromonas tetraodonis]|jgi:hypothetical protein